MRVLVTGSDGLVGREVVSELKNRKHSVIEFDLTEGHNILHKSNLEKALKNIDLVIHLAGIIDNSNPNLWEVNVTGTKNIIEESVKNRVKKFIFLSSTGVYGETHHMITEDSAVHPQNQYEKSKCEAEQIVLNHQEEIHVNVIRSAMILGPNAYWKSMFKILKKDFPLPCSGNNHFQIIYVRELVRSMITILENGEPGEIYLVAGKEQWTLREFCKKSKGIMGKKERIWSIPKLFALIFGKIMRIKLISRDNIRHLCKERKYSLEKIEDLGYVQKYPLKEAIIETLEELKELDPFQKN